MSTRKFKNGDKVRRIGPSLYGVVQDEEYIVSEWMDPDNMLLVGMSRAYSPDRFVLVEEAPTSPAPTIAPEIGKRYVLRDGTVTGEVNHHPHPIYPFRARAVEDTVTWTLDGQYVRGKTNKLDIVAEYVEAPAVTAPAKPATISLVVPHTYDRGLTITVSGPIEKVADYVAALPAGVQRMVLTELLEARRAAS